MFLPAAFLTASASEATVLNVGVSDPDGDPLTLEVRVQPLRAIAGQVGGALQIVPNELGRGGFDTITLAVSDGVLETTREFPLLIADRIFLGGGALGSDPLAWLPAGLPVDGEVLLLTAGAGFVDVGALSVIGALYSGAGASLVASGGLTITGDAVMLGPDAAGRIVAPGGITVTSGAYRPLVDIAGFVSASPSLVELIDTDVEDLTTSETVLVGGFTELTGALTANAVNVPAGAALSINGAAARAEVYDCRIVGTLNGYNGATLAVDNGLVFDGTVDLQAPSQLVIGLPGTPSETPVATLSAATGVVSLGDLRVTEGRASVLGAVVSPLPTHSIAIDPGSSLDVGSVAITTLNGLRVDGEITASSGKVTVLGGTVSASVPIVALVAIAGEVRVAAGSALQRIELQPLARATLAAGAPIRVAFLTTRGLLTAEPGSVFEVSQLTVGALGVVELVDGAAVRMVVELGFNPRVTLEDTGSFRPVGPAVSHLTEWTASGGLLCLVASACTFEFGDVELAPAVVVDLSLDSSLVDVTVDELTIGAGAAVDLDSVTLRARVCTGDVAVCAAAGG